MVSRFDAMRSAASTGEVVKRVDFAGFIQFATQPPPAGEPGETFAAYKSADGFIHLDGRINSADVVYRYADDQGNEWGELRTKEHVFATHVLEAWKRSTLTNEHPDAKVTPDTYREHAIGSLGSNVRPSADQRFTLADIAVCEAQAIAQVESGKTGLSCGYGCRLVEKRGELDGVAYDFIQTDYQPNHVSVVYDPRGAGCAFVIDGIRSLAFPTTGDTRTMKKIKIPKTTTRDGKTMVGETEVEVPDEVAALIEQLRAQNAELAAKLAEGESAAGESQAGMPIVDAEMDPEMDPEAETMDAKGARSSAKGDAADKARIKFLETQLAARENVDAKIDARLALGHAATRILGADFTIAGKSDSAVKIAIVKRVSPEFSFDGLDVKKPEVVDAVYKLALRTHEAHSDSSGDLLSLAGLAHRAAAKMHGDSLANVDLDQLRDDAFKPAAG